MFPSGTVSFLFTDIEGSTQLAQQYPDHIAELLRRHHAIIQNGVKAHDGYTFEIIGDAVCAAFQTVRHAFDAALEIQRVLTIEAWTPAPIKVRMGIHTGSARLRTEAGHRSGYSGHLSLAHVQRVMSAAHGGQILLSNASAELLRAELPHDASLRDVGEHRLKGLLNPEHLWQVLAPGLARNFPPIASLNGVPNNLPLQLTTFVGREREITEVRKLVETHRLVTLTGSGGTGKTRLSLQIAAETLDQFHDGVWFMELAPISDAALVPQVALSVFNLSEGPGRKPLDVLCDYLAAKSLLIILDNCEHLRSACCGFAEAALRAAPAVRLLATGREALNLRGEQTYRVPSMTAPDVRHLPSLEQLTQFEAVSLFVERARLAVPDFAVTHGNAPAIAQICARLDGIPLALELAAARLKSVPLDVVASHLDDRFRLLTGGSSTLLPRQQTLRATIDWSYALLSESEKLALQRMSVFKGGNALEAAEAVCAGPGVEQDEVLDLLSRLTDKSLLGLDERGRYRMLETVRQYAAEKLIDTGAAEETRDRHLAFMLTLAETAEPELHGHDQLIWLDRLELELDNLRAALGWAQDCEAELFLRLASALWSLWHIRSRANEGLDWLTKALAVNPTLHTAVRARALGRAGYIALNRMMYSDAQRNAQEGAALSRELNDISSLVMCLQVQGMVEVEHSKNQAGLAFLDECLSLSKKIGDHGIIGSVLYDIGQTALWRGDLEISRSMTEEAVHELRLSGDKSRLAVALGRLGLAVLAQQEAAQAKSVFQEALGLAAEIGDRAQMIELHLHLLDVSVCLGDFVAAQSYLDSADQLAQASGDRVEMVYILVNAGGLALAQDDTHRASDLFERVLVLLAKEPDHFAVVYALNGLGGAARRQGDFAAAQARYVQVFSISNRIGVKWGYCFCLAGFGALALVRGQPERAARLFAAREHLHASLYVEDYYPSEVRDREDSIAEARAQLGDEAFSAAWAAGQAMSEEEMLAYVKEGF